MYNAASKTKSIMQNMQLFACLLDLKSLVTIELKLRCLFVQL